MHELTLPFVPTKIYNSIFVDFKKKRIFFSFSLLSLSLWIFFSFLLTFLLFIFFSYFILFYFILFFYYFFLILSFPLFPSLDTWLNVNHLHKCNIGHVMCHPIPNTSKNLKFRLSRNPTKFDEVTRFRETNSTMKSISSSEI